MKIGQHPREQQPTNGRHGGTTREEEVRLGPGAVANLAKELKVQQSFDLLAKVREERSDSFLRWIDGILATHPPAARVFLRCAFYCCAVFQRCSGWLRDYQEARMITKLEGLYTHIRQNANNNDRLHEALVKIRQLEEKHKDHPPTLGVLMALRGMANGCIDLRTQIPILARIDEQIAREKALEAQVRSLKQSQRKQADELQGLQTARESQAQEIQNLHTAKTSLAMQGEKALGEMRKNHEREMAQLRAQLAHVNVQMASHQQMMEVIVRRCISSGRSDEDESFRLHYPQPAGEIEYPSPLRSRQGSPSSSFSSLSSSAGSDSDASMSEWTNLYPSSGLFPPPSSTGSRRSDLTL